jgi:tetratricopeptide (TPR) repeat protein
VLDTTPDAQALFQAGFAAHGRGDLDEAEAAYAAVLALTPDHFDALHLLGTLCVQTGRAQRGVELISRAIALDPSVAPAHSNLGVGLTDLDRPVEALASHDQALALDADFANAHFNRGKALHRLRRLDEAIASYDRAIVLDPAYSQALRERGEVLRDMMRFDEAVAAFDGAIALRPDLAGAHNGRGVALGELGRHDDALASFDAAIALQPDDPTAHNNRGASLRALLRIHEAIAAFDQALALSPDFAMAWNNRGNALYDVMRLDEALASYERTIALNPDWVADAHANLGNTLNHLGRVDEAVASFERAIALEPQSADLHAAFANTLLLDGRFEEGWREFEWRWRTAQFRPADRGFHAPLWRGEPIGERTLLLHGEQGLGDSLQFCRYAALIGTGARVVLEVQRPLARLMRSLAGPVEVIARGDALPAFDRHLPLVSLPLALGTILETIPAEVPYLAADPADIARWRARLAPLRGLKVGLVWAGDARRGQGVVEAIDARRSTSLAAMAPLAGASGVAFVSLQKGEPARQATDPPPGLRLFDATQDLKDFADTAALVASLDLVISVDTSVAHLAGALGKPVWLLNRYDTCWRWLRGRDDSPWYPTMRQFRQPRPGDWPSVMAAVREALGEWARPLQRRRSPALDASRPVPMKGREEDFAKPEPRGSV